MESSSGTTTSLSMKSENCFERTLVKQEPYLNCYTDVTTISKVEFENNHTSANRSDNLWVKTEAQEMKDESGCVQDISVKREPQVGSDTEMHVSKDNQEVSFFQYEPDLNTVSGEKGKCAVISLGSKVEYDNYHTSVKIFDNLVVKPEPQDIQDENCKNELKDGSNAEIFEEEKRDLSVKPEAGDPEAAGRGVDGSLRGRLEEDFTSPGIHYSKNLTFHLILDRFYSISEPLYVYSVCW